MPADEDRVLIGSPRSRRPLAIFFAVLANTLLFLALAYFLVGRSQLPGFVPHAAAASQSPDANDVPMGVVTLGLAGLALYGAVHAQSHRSWLRTRSWHRKHGRM